MSQTIVLQVILILIAFKEGRQYTLFAVTQPCRGDIATSYSIDKGGERDHQWKRTVYMYVHLQS